MPSTYSARLERNGRILIPAELRKRFGLKTGDELLMHADDRGVYVTTSRTTIRAVQEQVRAWLPGVSSLADEVLAARKEHLWNAPTPKRRRRK